MEPCRIVLRALFCAATVLAGTAADAAQTQTTFQVTSSVPGFSTVTAEELVFGDYDGSQSDLTSSIAIRCSKGTSFQIGLDNGLHFRAPHRRLKHRSAAHYLIYELYRDSGRTARWGNDDASSVHMTCDGTEQRITVYGRVPAGQTGPAGSYSNTTTVTVNF